FVSLCFWRKQNESRLAFHKVVNVSGYHETRVLFGVLGCYKVFTLCPEHGHSDVIDFCLFVPQESYFATVKLIYTVGYGASLLSLSVAVAILLLFRRLHCARNYIHMQLFFTFILKSVAVFIKDATLFSSDDTDHCTLSTAACKASVVLCHYCVMTNFFWLLVEAVYLNFLLVSAFPRSRRCLWSFALLGWGFPLVCIILWICSRLYFEDTECWDINEDSPYWWIIKGPIVVSIGVNFFLFMNIIRILVQKLNPRLIQFNNSSQYRYRNQSNTTNPCAGISKTGQ
uniref:Growth hormone releasing hormone receptor n=1 Tax=Sinocyclocheilus grahami TaxID=75366 RepID=A0A672T4Z3_SINGR